MGDISISANPFIGMDVETLALLRSKYAMAVADIATNGQSEAIDGRSMTRADLDKVKETLKQIGDALALANGTGRIIRKATPDMRNARR